jgi:hypothetical protein
MGRSVAGYYSSADEYSRLANPYSNEHEMFYVALDGGMRPGTDFYESVLMHEFQHMIHWAQDRNETTWVNEGCAELASYVGGYSPGGFDRDFLADPDLQLNTWPEVYSAAPHYGASYLFVRYLYDRFGPGFIRSLVAQTEDGIWGLDVVLAEHRVGFEQVFADWAIANYVDGLGSVSQDVDARYTYAGESIGRLDVDQRHSAIPVSRETTVHQYGADYVELGGGGERVIEFAGEPSARLVPADAFSGRYTWWSNRGDDSDMTLTRPLDLRALEGAGATLQVQMWYDIEPDWDYAYVEVSADEGATWEILAGPSSTLEDPNGNSLGAAYTGSSGDWIAEVFDLSAYAGQQILVRFEYVTDDAVNRAGWLIDDVCVPELAFCDDLESGPGEWQARGFVYSDNLVAQRYVVQVILLSRERNDGDRAVRVLQMPLDAEQRGVLALRGLGEEDEVVLVVSAMAPATTEVAAYEYSVERLP